MWGGPHSTWNPIVPNATPGTGGLVYETLFSYNPLKNEYRPWLAESGGWVSDNEYLVKVRKGIKWTDGRDFHRRRRCVHLRTGEKQQSYPTLRFGSGWAQLSLKINIRSVLFSANPITTNGTGKLYQRYIIPKHIWSKVKKDEIFTIQNAKPVGTGPYKYHTYGPDRMVWVRNDKWWGNEVFGTPKPKYIVDLVNVSNNITFGDVDERRN